MVGRSLPTGIVEKKDYEIESCGTTGTSLPGRVPTGQGSLSLGIGPRVECLFGSSDLGVGGSDSPRTPRV